jgi:hypothetical protein
MNAVRLGQIVVRGISKTTLRTPFPDCEIAAVGADCRSPFSCGIWPMYIRFRSRL